MLRLGVNVDHVATLRQARGEAYPSIVDAARMCLQEGTDQITIHLREDRRHIQDDDVPAMRKLTLEHGKLLNLEMGCHDEICQVALKHRPDWVCLVPEKREEKTTEGGLNLLDESQWQKVRQTCERLKKGHPSVKISLFLEADKKILDKVLSLPIDAVEIHTGSYAKVFQEKKSLGEREADSEKYWDQFQYAKRFLQEHSLGCHAGHGLTYESVLPLLKRGYFVEYNIGHWIICEAIFMGLSQVIRKLKGQFDAHSKLTGNEGN